MPALPIFTFSCLLLTYLVWNGSPLLPYLNSRWSLYIGLAATVASGALTLSPRIHYRWRYDLFSFGCLLTWFAYWHQFFEIGAPVFSFYPVYFVLLSIFVTHFVIHKRSHLAADQIQLMRILYGFAGMRAPILVVLVLGSLLIPGHYLIYPIVMTLLLVRYAFAVCLEE
jgi:hypothetical protein